MTVISSAILIFYCVTFHIRSQLQYPQNRLKQRVNHIANLERFKPPLTRPSSVTLPPALVMRFVSISSVGLWSNDISMASPPRLTTHLPSNGERIFVEDLRSSVKKPEMALRDVRLSARTMNPVKYTLSLRRWRQIIHFPRAKIRTPCNRCRIRALLLME